MVVHIQLGMSASHLIQLKDSSPTIMQTKIMANGFIEMLAVLQRHEKLRTTLLILSAPMAVLVVETIALDMFTPTKRQQLRILNKQHWERGIASLPFHYTRREQNNGKDI